MLALDFFRKEINYIHPTHPGLSGLQANCRGHHGGVRGGWTKLANFHI